MIGRGLLQNRNSAEFRRVSPGMYRGPDGQIIKSKTNPGQQRQPMPQIQQVQPMQPGQQQQMQLLPQDQQLPPRQPGQGFGSMGSGPMSFQMGVNNQVQGPGPEMALRQRVSQFQPQGQQQQMQIQGQPMNFMPYKG